MGSSIPNTLNTSSIFAGIIGQRIHAITARSSSAIRRLYLVPSGSVFPVFHGCVSSNCLLTPLIYFNTRSIAEFSFRALISPENSSMSSRHCENRDSGASFTSRFLLSLPTTLSGISPSQKLFTSFNKRLKRLPRSLASSLL